VKAWAILAAVGCVVLATACRGSALSPEDDGRPRIVSLHDVTTELLVELGAVERIVGIAKLVDGTADVERAVAGIPRVGGLETILSRKPNVVVGLSVVEEQSPDLVAHLRKRGVDVYLADPKRIEDIYLMTIALGERAQATRAARRVLAEMQAKLALDVPASGTQPSVFVYDCCDPPFTAGGKTVLTDVIKRAGGENLFRELDADWTHVSWEEVVARKPDLIVVHAYEHDGQLGVLEKRQRLERFPSLAGVPTVVLPLGESLGGLRSADGFVRLRGAIAGLP